MQIDEMKTEVTSEQEKHAIEKKILETELQSKIDEMASFEQTAKDKEEVLQQKLKETEEDRDHLKSQVANSEDYSKLLDNTMTQGNVFLSNFTIKRTIKITCV